VGSDSGGGRRGPAAAGKHQLPRHIRSGRDRGAASKQWSMYLRERFLGYDDILDACCAAWNALLAEAGRIRSLCTLE